MSAIKQTKINRLLAATPREVVLLSSWLKKQGYSYSLIRRYEQSGWLEPIGTGAVIRSGDKVDYYGALYTLQTQNNLQVHVGGRSAFALLNKAHYLELATKKLVLFGTRGKNLPKWFTGYDWQVTIEYHSSNFLPADLGIAAVPVKEFKVKVSDEIRALMECLYLAPQRQDLAECYELMEGMNSLRPEKVQALLENCDSIKVKRLFLCLAERIGHTWFKYINLANIDLGTGKRSIVKGGVLDKKYQITIPKEWSNDDISEL
jgi:hypothetical protein